MTKILIATDGSETARAAAASAGTLLGDPSSVTVLCVVTSIPEDDAGGIEGSTETPKEAEREAESELHDANAAIDAVVAVLPESWRPKVTRRIEAGDAGAMVEWVAEHEASDLVVVGSHGNGILQRLVMGSVSRHVLHHAPCPVLLVRAQS
jgi:nucleotide-binding universal stress UspA family protein